MANNHCTDEALLAYALRELAESESTKVADHLAVCEPCRAGLEKLSREFRLIADFIEHDEFVPRDRAERARAGVLHQMEEFEANLSQWLWRKLLWPPIIPRRAAAAAGVALVAAAVTAYVFRSGGEVSSLDAPTVLAAAQSQEGAFGFSASHQRFRVEIAEAKAAEPKLRGELEIWSVPEEGKYASRWSDEEGTVQHAIWNRPGEDGSFRFDASVAPEIVPTVAVDQAGLFPLVKVRGAHLDEAVLATTFLTWLRERPWKPIRFTDDIMTLAHESGTSLEMKRVPASGRELLRLTAWKETEGGTTEVVLDVDAEDYRPLAMRIRFHTGGRVAEIHIETETARIVAAASFEPEVFEPSLSSYTHRNIKPPQPVTTPDSPPSSVVRNRPSPQEQVTARIRIRHALHQIGACRLEPVTVKEEDNGGLAVTAIVGSEESKFRMQVALSDAELPDWVRFDIKTVEAAVQESAPGDTPPEPATPSERLLMAPTGGRLPIQKCLEEHFAEYGLPTGGEAHSDPTPPAQVSERIMAFSHRAVVLSENTFAEAAALRHLTEWFGGTPDLDTESTRLLLEMLNDHIRAFRREHKRTVQWVFPVLGQVGCGASGVVSTAPGLSTQSPGREAYGNDWQTAIWGLYRDAERMHNAITDLLTLTVGRRNTPHDGEQALLRWLAAMQGVDARLQDAALELSELRLASVPRDSEAHQR